jgi:ribosomal protein S18 acetylase RimI-like enzyme
MKIRKMTNEDFLAVGNVHKEAFPRQLPSKAWITCNFNAHPMNDKPTTENLIFREVQISDVSSLIPLMDQLGYPIDKEVMSQNIQKYMLLPNQKAWVAESSNQILGCIAVAITNYFHRPGSFLRVITMIVSQEQRRSGIGKSLMSIAEKFAMEQDCSHIELTSGIHREKLGSHKFYQSLGYIELNEIKKYFAKKLK